jgi:type IV pilus assembly protein PilE
MVKSTKKSSFGLTLVELMVTIAVLAIIAAIGYPMYTTQVQKGRRADAKAGVTLLEMAQVNERGKWGGFSEPDTAIPGITNDDGLPAPDANSVFNDDLRRIGAQFGEYYSFNITADNTTFTITATPVPPQDADTTCAVFTVNQAGQKTAEDSGGGDQTDLCW